MLKFGTVCLALINGVAGSAIDALVPGEVEVVPALVTSSSVSGAASGSQSAASGLGSVSSGPEAADVVLPSPNPEVMALGPETSGQTGLFDSRNPLEAIRDKGFILLNNLFKESGNSEGPLDPVGVEGRHTDFIQHDFLASSSGVLQEGYRAGVTGGTGSFDSKSTRISNVSEGLNVSHESLNSSNTSLSENEVVNGEAAGVADRNVDVDKVAVADLGAPGIEEATQGGDKSGGASAGVDNGLADSGFFEDENTGPHISMASAAAGLGIIGAGAWACHRRWRQSQISEVNTSFLSASRSSSLRPSVFGSQRSLHERYGGRR